MLALMGLLPWTATVTADCLAFDGRDLLTMPARARRRIIGKDMAMIFQEPMTSLNPCFTVGFQITESLKRSEEHTSELQSLMRISYAVFCLKKTTKQNTMHIRRKTAKATSPPNNR